MFCILAMQPILNAFAFYYLNKGVSVNYGAARGIGSLCYSGCSMLLGMLTVQREALRFPAAWGFLRPWSSCWSFSCRICRGIMYPQEGKRKKIR